MQVLRQEETDSSYLCMLSDILFTPVILSLSPQSTEHWRFSFQPDS